MTTQPLSALTMLLSRHTKRREFITLLVPGVEARHLLGGAARDDVEYQSQHRHPYGDCSDQQQDFGGRVCP